MHLTEALARRVRGHRRCALPRSRAGRCRCDDAAPGRTGRRTGLGTLRCDWTIDWDYHRDDPKHLFRPWGFQPGHQTEWAKLLLILDRHAPQDWLLPTATRLFETAIERAWDDVNGGLFYGFAPDGSICDSDKYFWVQAESLAAAALLGERTGDLRHIDDYDKSLGLRVATFRRPRTRRLVPHPRSRRTANIPTRRARPARPTTTPWAPATKCLRSRAVPRRHEPRHGYPTMKTLLGSGLAAVLFLATGWSHAAAETSSKAGVDAAASALLASEVKTEFLHAWKDYKQYAWGHDDLAPLSHAPHDWYGQSLLMTPVDALDTLVLMGLTDEAERRTRTDRDAARFRQGHLRQELRDHDPPARRTSVRLPADRRRAPAGQGRGSRHAPASRYSIHRPACPTSRSICAPARRATRRPIRPKPAPCCSSSARCRS